MIQDHAQGGYVLLIATINNLLLLPKSLLDTYSEWYII